MDRERIFLLIATPIIAFALFLLWKEYDEYYGEAPTAHLPEISQLKTDAQSMTLPSSKNDVVLTAANSSRGMAIETTPEGRTPTQKAVIARAKTIPVSTLDASLPHQPIGEWMKHTAGSSARILWETNDCGEAAKEPGSAPVCAQADVDFSDGTKFQTLLLVGARSLKSREMQYASPSLLWAAYSNSEGENLTPAPLSALTRIAQQAN